MRIPILWILISFGSDAVGQSDTLKPVRVNHMTRGYFYASSFGPAHLNGFGGWGGSVNPSKQSEPLPGSSGLEIAVDTISTVPLIGKYRGLRVAVRNNGPDTLFFPAQDSRLYMKTQALQEDSFADIEYLPSSWCGNSYHTLFLAPGEHWTFVMPKYEGRTRTRLRLELLYRLDPEANDERRAYSLTFPGSINRGQFNKKRNYRRKGMMDPYND